MRLKSLALATGIAAAGVLGVAGTANAAPTLDLRVSEAPERVVRTSDVGVQREYLCWWAYDANGVVRGEGCFAAEGDHVLANDTLADGYSVRVDWATDYDRDGACKDTGGAPGGGNDCDYNMDEDGRFHLQIELWDAGSRGPETKWFEYVPIGQ